MSETVTAPIAPVTSSAPATPQMVDALSPATIPLENPQRSFNDSIKAIAFKTGVAAEPVVETPSVKFVRDAKAAPDAPGSPDAPPGSTAPAIATPAVPTDAPTGAVSEISLDDGEVTLTSQRNADGTFKTKLDPNEKVDLVIKSVVDPETGKPKVYSKSLPELARLAKDGITLQQTVQQVKGEMQALQPEVEYYRSNVETWKQQSDTLSQRLADMEALNRELLSAPDEVVISHRDRYKQEMSPERQLERIQAERAAEQETQRQTEARRQATARKERHEQVAKSFMDARIAPTIKAAQDAGLPRALVTGLVTELTSDLLVNGVIPPAQWPEMERRLTAPDGPFQREVATERARRSQDSDTVKAAREAAEAAQRRAQQAVNTDGRLMAPIGRAGPESAPTLPKAKNVQEVKDRIINRPLPVSVGGLG